MLFPQLLRPGWNLFIFDGAVEDLATDDISKYFIFHGIGTENCYVIGSGTIIDVDESVRVGVVGFGHL